MAYPLLDSGLSADALERQLLERWRAEDLFHRVNDATRGGTPFVFFEGPPTANGRPGIHHVFARTIKDLICRYQTMRGRSVTRKAGWDTHGLPVEIEVEKQQGLTGKKQIEDFGVAEFNRLCRESVFRYKRDWEELSERIGYWLDYDRPYATYTNDYVESVWWLLRRLYDRDLLYRGHKVLPYCPRCGTALSSHELALGYDTVQTNTVYVALPLADDRDRRLVVWTTTPWTLLSNVAVAVHPELVYGEYEAGGTRYVVAVERAAHVHVGGRPLADARLVATRSGRDLLGWRYVRPLDVVPLPAEGDHGVVVPGDFVTAGDGTGLVHMAPAFGADDYEAGRRHGLAFVNPVAADGTFQGTAWPEIEGRVVTDKATNQLIIDRLKREGGWLETLPHSHTYPFCWRCDSPLIYYARSSWFVRTTAFRDRMLAVNGGVAWHPPEVGSGRFGAWLANNVDWALSRDRYWGTPLCVWECDREPRHRDVIGSFAELAERWGRPLPSDFDPHKPHIDAYVWGCGACAGTMRRVPEVVDAWFDSGAMPYAQWHYPFAGEAEFRAHFPADFICEGVDQTRGWFYSLLAIAVGAFDGPAYRDVIVNELVLDAHGQKMSKSRGNVVEPSAVIADAGADALRLYLLGQSQVWLPKRFDAGQIPELAGGFLKTLRSTYDFFSRYAGDWAPERSPAESGRPLVDRWLLARLDEVTASVRAAWDGFDATAGVRVLFEFVVDELSNWYVRVNRSRFWAPDREADPAALATLHEALVTVARLLAPAAPFLADWLHRALAGTSVHLARFPEDRGRRAPDLLRAMAAVRRLATLTRAAREARKLRVRQPVGGIRVAVPGADRTEALAALLDILAAEVNAKNCEVVASDDALVSLRGRANFRALGRRYGKDTPRAADAAARLPPDALRAIERGETVTAGGFTFGPEDVTVGREVASDWEVASDGPYVVAVDPTVTDALMQEGLAREVVNRVQRLRREAGYDYAARIELAVSGDAEVVEAARRHLAFIEGETLTRRTVLGGALDSADVTQDVDIEGRRLTIAVRRHDGRKGDTG
jgi:isoleucyl-tRNA synthetase